MNSLILAESNPVVKQYHKPAMGRLTIAGPDSAGYYLEVARVADTKSGAVFGVVSISTPAGLFCECRPLMEYLTSAPCVHMVAVIVAGIAPAVEV